MQKPLPERIETILHNIGKDESKLFSYAPFLEIKKMPFLQIKYNITLSPL